MSGTVAGSVLRRKAQVVKTQEKPGLTAARAIRASILRAAEAIPGFRIEVDGVEERGLTLSELMEVAEAPALYAVLSGPGEALGMATLSPGLAAALVEARMTGRINPSDPPARRTTRTNAMLVGRFLGAVLDDLGRALEFDADVTWAGGFRYTSCLDDLRPLGLMLEEGVYRLVSVPVRLMHSTRGGTVCLALPAAGRGPQPAVPAPPKAETPGGAGRWNEDMERSVAMASVRLEAVISRFDLPLAAIASLQPGMVIPLGTAAVEAIDLAGMDGRTVVRGRLGQSQGFRAIRLALPSD